MTAPNPIRQSINWVPINGTWADWNGNMVHYYGEEPIPYVSEDEWQTVADYLSGLATFTNYLIPDSATYADWREWAKDFIEAVNGATR